MTAKITGDNSVITLNKVKDNTSVFVRLWKRGKEILTPLRDVLDTIAGVGSNFAPEYDGATGAVAGLERFLRYAIYMSWNRWDQYTMGTTWKRHGYFGIENLKQKT